MKFTVALLLWIPIAQAKPLDGPYLKNLRHQNSKEKLAKLTESHFQIRLLRKICREQLVAEIAPTECYALLQLDFHFQLINTGERSYILEKLDHKCEVAAARLKIPANFTLSVNISPKCRLAINEAQSVREYQTEGSSIWPGI